MIYAIGLPGQLPRLWVETAKEEQAVAQLQPGENWTDQLELGDDGRPVPAPIPLPAEKE